MRILIIKYCLFLSIIFLIGCNYSENEAVDILCGKKWYVLGDSFSSNGWGEYSKDYRAPRFSDGIYRGEIMIYPYFVGNRTGIEVHNYAVPGMTLTNIDQNSLLKVYKKVPPYADYLTIKIGINDNHRDVAIGTINSEDPSTFFGAYNIILKWLKANRPNTRIGIIISNGCSSPDYPNATREIAKKYNIPYLDLELDDNIPYYLRQVQRTFVSDSIKDLLDKKYCISPSNKHPNEKAHELESYYVEHFLRKLSEQ